MALIYAGVPFETREISLRNKPLSMLALSPKGTVPVLYCEGGRVIDESLNIMLWALSLSDSHNWFLPSNRQEILAVIQKNDQEFKPLLDRYKYPERYVDSKGAFEKAVEQHIKPLSDRLSVNRYLLGANQSLADIAIFPFVRQFARVNVVHFETLSYVRVNEWLNELMSMEIYLQAMQKYPVWEEEPA
jgi:glutathione S-transferase